MLIGCASASGLGRACVEDICRAGGYVAILDMNEELAQELVKEIGGGKAKFFETNVLETESIEAAVKGTLAWVKDTGKEVGGVIAAAGVSTPAKVCSFSSRIYTDFPWRRSEQGLGDLMICCRI